MNAMSRWSSGCVYAVFLGGLAFVGALFAVPGSPAAATRELFLQRLVNAAIEHTHHPVRLSPRIRSHSVSGRRRSRGHRSLYRRDHPCVSGSRSRSAERSARRHGEEFLRLSAEVEMDSVEAGRQHRPPPRSKFNDLLSAQGSRYRLQAAWRTTSPATLSLMTLEAVCRTSESSSIVKAVAEPT
jgi:hypothetical protein